MSVFDIISLLGGLSMFLYGMRLMGDTLQEGSSGTLKVVMEKVTNNPIKAFLLGLGVTAIIQSSTATIVLTSGLVAAGIISLRSSLGIIIGANVGTTVTGQIIRLLDVEASANSVLRIFQPSTLAPIALIIGIICIMFLKFKNSHTVGNIAIGFGILFSGLLNMTAAVNVLSENGMIDSLFQSLGDNMWLGYLVGAGVAFLLQSSSATIGILQAFALSGTIPFKSAFIVIVGIYLGDCLTTGIVCSIGAKPDAKRVGLVNILFNLSETILVLAVVLILHTVGAIDGLWNMSMTPGTIANTNTIFNLGCAILLLPLVGVYEKLSKVIVKDKPASKSKNKYDELLGELNPIFFKTPAIAFNSCFDVLKTMLDSACSNIRKSVKLLTEYNAKTVSEINEEEDNIDMMTDSLSEYLMQLSPHISDENHILILDQYNKLVTEFERLGDHATNISEAATALYDLKTPLSDTAKEELSVTIELLDRILNLTYSAFVTRDIESAKSIEPLEDVMDDLVNALHDNHLKRLRSGNCSSHTGIYFLDILSNLERISDTCSNIGISVVARVNPEVATLAHNYVTSLHQGKNDEFQAAYQSAHSEFFGKLSL